MNNIRNGNKELIKDLNRARVIEQIRNFGPISRTEISKNIKLGLPTVTNIVETLKQNRLVQEVGSASSTGGRRPVLLEFNYEFGYTIGVKIEEQHLLFAVTDLNGSILRKMKIDFQKGEGSEKILQLASRSIRELLKRAEIPKDKLLGIGVAVSGLINSKEGKVIRSSLLGWEDVNVKAKLEDKFETPVFIDNDVNAYTLAELWLGYGKTHDNFICVSVGAGIGAGIVIDRKLYYGNLGGAGEFGHMIVHFGGHLCHCGQRGCLEMYASEKFLQKEISKLSDHFSDDLLKQENPTFESVHQTAVKGDNSAIKLLQRTGEHLGVGLVSIINSLNPSTIIFIGEGMNAQEYFLPAAIETASQNFFAKVDGHTGFYVSELGEDAWLSGAAILAINQMFQAPIYEENHSII